MAARKRVDRDEERANAKPCGVPGDCPCGSRLCTGDDACKCCVAPLEEQPRRALTRAPWYPPHWRG